MLVPGTDAGKGEPKTALRPGPARPRFELLLPTSREGAGTAKGGKIRIGATGQGPGSEPRIGRMDGAASDTCTCTRPLRSSYSSSSSGSSSRLNDARN